MITSKYRLELARKLKLYKEVSTEDGTVLIAEAEEMAVGVEVFVDGENGLEPARDGEYVDTVNNVIYTVAGGTITEIKEKENTMEPASEENEVITISDNEAENNEGSENGNDNGSDNGEAGSNAESEGQDNGEDSEMETLKAENEALKAKIAELEATVSDLEDQVAAYKAKEEETAPAAEEAEKFASQKPKTDFDKTMEAAKLIMKAVK